MAKPKNHPLFGDPMPLSFSRRLVTCFGFETLELIRKKYYRFSDAFHEVAHKHMTFREEGSNRYDQLREAVAAYCRQRDFNLFLRAERRPWGNHQRLAETMPYRRPHASPSVEGMSLAELGDAIWPQMEYLMYIHCNHPRLFEFAFHKAARNQGVAHPSGLYDELFDLMVTRCQENLEPKMRAVVFSRAIQKPVEKKSRLRAKKPLQIALPLEG